MPLTTMWSPKNSASPVGPAAREDVRRQHRALAGDEVVVERVTGERRVEELAVVLEHPVLDGEGRLVGKAGRSSGLPGSPVSKSSRMM